MPSAVKKERRGDASPPSESLDDASVVSRLVDVAEKKIRNLEKRKAKLDQYKEEQESGAELQAGQAEALSRVGEVEQTLLAVREMQKAMQQIAAEHARALKRSAKGAQKGADARGAESRRHEAKQLRELLRFQDMLNLLNHDESHRPHFERGTNNAIKLSDEEMHLVDRLYETFCPTCEDSTTADEWQRRLDDCSERTHLILTASARVALLKQTGKELRDFLDRLLHCDYMQGIYAASRTQSPPDQQMRQASPPAVMPTLDQAMAPHAVAPMVFENSQQMVAPTDVQPPRGGVTMLNGDHHQADNTFLFMQPEPNPVMVREQLDLSSMANVYQQQTFVPNVLPAAGAAVFAGGAPPPPPPIPMPPVTDAQLSPSRPLDPNAPTFVTQAVADAPAAADSANDAPLASVPAMGANGERAMGLQSGELAEQQRDADGATNADDDGGYERVGGYHGAGRARRPVRADRGFRGAYRGGRGAADGGRGGGYRDGGGFGGYRRADGRGGARVRGGGRGRGAEHV